MLSSIQQGVQNFHVIAEMFTKYDDNTLYANARTVLHDWATKHKTAIFLNGGNAEGIRSVYDTLVDYGMVLDLPFDYFCEDRESLDNSMTACGIIVPTRIIDIASTVRTTPCDWTEYNSNWAVPPSATEIEFAAFLNQFQLAR